MPRSTTFLPDVNVWLALTSARHVHASTCARWFDSVAPAKAAFCRVTQMGLLRLLTNESAMGRDVVSCREAWRTYRAMRTDERVQFAPEPFTLEQEWQRLTTLDRPAPKIWTDAYLAAFARAAGMRLVTLDRAVLAMAAQALLLS
ncbi:MAG: PIN domain-containing protein [Bryobacteraceae bacterium]|nr:PIN domain-containing protein [Bryobacteraceae bacterium]